MFLPDIRILHTHDNIVIVIEEGAIEGHNVLRVAAVHDLEFSNNTLAHLALRLDMDDLGPRLAGDKQQYSEDGEDGIPCGP